MTTRVFFDMTADGAPVGKIIMEVRFHFKTVTSQVFFLNSNLKFVPAGVEVRHNELAKSEIIKKIF